MTIECDLCPRACSIPEGRAGDCRIRVNIGGRLVATTYGRPSAVHVDPMEKKPLFHFLPGSPVFSVATAGCNLHCLNCQNWQLSQRGGEEMEEVFRAEPAELIAMVEQQGCLSIAYTYSEPVVFYEYTYDSSVLAHERGLRNVLVTAAYINQPPLRRLCGVIDAANVDLKAMDDALYREVTGATLKPVLDALVTMRELGVWIELTNLLIPTFNDQLPLIRRMARWIRTELGAGTPLHFSRFHPQYRMRNRPPTPGETLSRAREEALDAGLEYVYVGNIPGHPGNSTYCPRDGQLLIGRTGYWITENNLTSDGHCPTCGEAIPGVWQ